MHSSNKEHVAWLVAQYHNPSVTREERSGAACELYTKWFAPLIRQTVKKVALDHAIVGEEEIDQITCMQFFELLEGFDADKSNVDYFPKWVRNYLEWRVRQEVKKSYRWVPARDSEEALAHAGEEPDWEAWEAGDPQRDLGEDLYPAYQCMTAKQQRVIQVLLAPGGQNLTQVEIADKLGKMEGRSVTQQAVSARLGQIRKALTRFRPRNTNRQRQAQEAQ